MIQLIVEKDETLRAQKVSNYVSAVTRKVMSLSIISWCRRFLTAPVKQFGFTAL